MSEGTPAMDDPQPLLFELAWTAAPPVLANPGLGLDRVVSRGSRYSFTSDITLLDSTDHRLLRAGVILAHRVIDGLGEWYMDAPAWWPWLPVDHSVALDAAGDLPIDFACLVKPFLRGAPLSPVAALTCERTEIAVEQDDGRTLAVIRDDRITVAQSGVTTSRVREITITPRAVPTPEQREWVTSRILALGGVPVDEHPSVLARLGARSGALSDFPLPPRRLSPGVDAFASGELTTCLRRIVEADLSARSQGMDFGDGPTRRGEPRVVPEVRDSDELLGLGSDPVTAAPRTGVHTDGHGPIGGLLAQLRNLEETVDGLAGLLDPRWVDSLNALLQPLIDLDPREMSVHRLPEGYYQLLDALVLGARAPRIVVDPAAPARQLMRRQARKAVTEVLTTCSQLEVTDDQGWARARRAVAHAVAVSRVVPDSHRAVRAGRRLVRIQDALAGTGSVLEAPTPAEVALMTPQTAYEAGREAERRVVVQAHLRTDFTERWPRLRSKLVKVMEES
ncbi:hypothetical protein [Acidipropionibacterium timonense]|uniref:hypothetical protein n=1 Tax=Acidipropionibacterium timonense TaxID=2161818 RepID=UPI001FDA5999|nr:hypothetical protein [Acidipropionibacterium timonense]